MRRTLLMVLVGASTAAADPKLSMRWVSGENIHLAGQGGAINRSVEARVAIDLLAKAKLHVIDTGTWSEHNLYPTFSTDEQTTWTNTWSGSWTKTKSSLKLELELTDRKCAKSKTETGVATKSLPCADVAKQIAFACTSETIDVAIGDKTRKQLVWHCPPTSAVDLADTPSLWILDQRGACLKIGAGRMGEPGSYEPC